MFSPRLMHHPNTALQAALRRGPPLAGPALLLTLPALAQPGGGGPGNGGATGVPLAGGASLLPAGAPAYGLRRLRRR